MKRILPPAFLILLFVLVACSANSTPLPAAPPVDSPQAAVPASTEASPPLNNFGVRIDQQGAIVIEVTPLNLEAPADTLEFNVVMDTHTIDLSMDLAALATLATDTGLTIQPALWDAPLGGHHVVGTLIFPAMKDGKSILADATKLTLTIVNADAPARVFEWTLK